MSPEARKTTEPPDATHARCAECGVSIMAVGGYCTWGTERWLCSYTPCAARRTMERERAKSAA